MKLGTFETVFEYTDDDSDIAAEVTYVFEVKFDAVREDRINSVDGFSLELIDCYAEDAEGNPVDHEPDEYEASHVTDLVARIKNESIIDACVEQLSKELERTRYASV